MPLAIIALYVQGTWQKILFGVLAIICAVSASYLVWKRERTRANDLEQRLLDVTDKRRLGQRLSELHQAGQLLMNWIIESDDTTSVDEVQEKVKDWLQSIAEVLGPISEAVLIQVVTVASVPVRMYSGMKSTATANKKAAIVTALLLRLETLSEVMTNY